MSVSIIVGICAGIATRKCLKDAIWAPANITFCENQAISDIRKMVPHIHCQENHNHKGPFFSIQAKELFEQPVVQVTDALMVLRVLTEAASIIAHATNMSQLPRDIETASDIVAKTVDLLLASTPGSNSSGGMQPVEVDVNEVCLTADVHQPCMGSFFHFWLAY